MSTQINKFFVSDSVRLKKNFVRSDLKKKQKNNNNKKQKQKLKTAETNKGTKWGVEDCRSHQYHQWTSKEFLSKTALVTMD